MLMLTCVLTLMVHIGIAVVVDGCGVDVGVGDVVVGRNCSDRHLVGRGEGTGVRVSGGVAVGVHGRRKRSQKSLTELRLVYRAKGLLFADLGNPISKRYNGKIIRKIWVA